MSEFAILEALLHRGPMTVGALGGRVLLTSGSITTAVDRLEAQALVERRLVSDDRRTRLVRLTPAGRRLITRAFRSHAEAMEVAAAGLAPKERATLLRLLKKLGKSAADVAQPSSLPGPAPAR